MRFITTAEDCADRRGTSGLTDCLIAHCMNRYLKPQYTAIINYSNPRIMLREDADKDDYMDYELWEDNCGDDELNSKMSEQVKMYLDGLAKPGFEFERDVPSEFLLS